jgi:HEAT repeat protein
MTDLDWDLVERQAWQPGGAEVLALARRLDADGLRALLTRLADPDRDDALRHRLALAVRCLAAVEPRTRIQLGALANDLGEAAFRAWWPHWPRRTADAVPHLGALLPLLARLDTRIEGRPLGVWLLERVKTEGGHESTWADELLSQEGRTLATPSLLSCLADLLAEDLPNRIRAALHFLRGLDEVSGLPALLDGLLRLYRSMPRDRHEVLNGIHGLFGELAPLRVAQSWSLRTFIWETGRPEPPGGLELVTPEGRERLAGWLEENLRDLLRSDIPLVSDTARLLVNEPDIQSQGLMEHLAAALWDNGPDFLPSFDEEDDVLWPALFSLVSERLGVAAGPVRLEILRRLGGLVQHLRTLQRNEEHLLRETRVTLERMLSVRERVAGLREMPELRGLAESLHALIHDPSPEVCRQAGRLLLDLHQFLNPGGPPSWLGALLADPDMTVCLAALDVLGHWGEAALPPETLDSLAPLLGDPRRPVRREALELARRLGLDQPPILYHLALLLADPDPATRGMARAAILDLGGKVAGRAFFDPLCQLLRDGNVLAWRSVFGLVKSSEKKGLPDLLAEELRSLPLGSRMVGVAQELGWEECWDMDQLLAGLMDRLGWPDRVVRRGAAWGLGLLQPGALSDELLTRLADLLGDGEEEVRNSALAAACFLGRALARPVFLNRLPGRLTGAGAGPRWVALEVLGVLGPAAATPGLLAAAEELLGGDNRLRWFTAVVVFARVEGMVPGERLRERVVELLYHRDPLLREAVLTLVRSLGPRLAGPELLDELLGLATVPDAVARLNVVPVLRLLEEEGLLQGEGVRRLTDMLSDSHAEVSQAALEALLSLGPTRLPPDVPGRITGLLRSPEKHRRRRALAALDRLGEALVPAVLQPVWPQLLRDLDPDVRYLTAASLDRLNFTERDLLARLPGLLRDPERSVRRLALAQVARLGPRALQEGIPAALADLLPHLAWGKHDEQAALQELWTSLSHLEPETRRVRISAALADLRRHPGSVEPEELAVLRGLGPALGCPAFLQGVDLLLSQDDPAFLVPTIRAVNVLGGQLLPAHTGGPAGTPVILRRLLRLLGHRQADVRLEAARSLLRHAQAGDRMDLLRRVGARITDPDARVREVAVQAVKRLRRKAWTEPLLDTLNQALNASDEGIALTGVRVVGRLGRLEEHPDVVDALAHLYGRGTVAGVWAAQQLARRGYRLLCSEAGSGWQAMPLAVRAAVLGP